MPSPPVLSRSQIWHASVLSVDYLGPTSMDEEVELKAQGLPYENSLRREIAFSRSRERTEHEHLSGETVSPTSRIRFLWDLPSHRSIVYSDSIGGTGGEPRGLLHFCNVRSGRLACARPLAGKHLWDNMTAERASADACTEPGVSVCPVCNDARLRRGNFMKT